MSKIKQPKIGKGTYPTKNTIITVTVDTERISHAETQEAVIESVTFDNNQGDGVGIGVPEYLSNVKSGTEITWVGAIKDLDKYPNDQVLIHEIKFKRKPKGKKGSPVVTFSDNLTKYGRTHVDGVVNEPIDENYFEYSIIFWVYHYSSGETKGRCFVIDPKLGVNN